MNYLLDTNTFLWSVNEPERLTESARMIIEDSANDGFVSHASIWEIAIKTASGKIRLATDVADFVSRQMVAHKFMGLPIGLSHVLAVATLPLLHGDLFDRLLVCQAQIEQLPIITNDRFIARYNLQVIW